MLNTRAQRRARAKAANFNLFMEVQNAATQVRGTDLDDEASSQEQHNKKLYAACVAEVEQQQKADEHAALAPVRELESRLNADRERAARNARYALTLPDYKWFLDTCPSFSQYTGEESKYLEAVRNTFVDFRNCLEATGVVITQSGLENLAALSEDNIGLDWTDSRTFSAVWDHCTEVQFLKAGRDYTVREEAKPAPVPEQPEDFDTLLKTRSADDPALRNAAHEFAIAEAQPTFQAWTESLMNSFGYAMSLPVAKQVSDWFLRMNRSFLDRTAYDECRRAFVREGLMPRTCLTPDDLAGEEMDKLDIRTVEGRRRAAQLHREGLRRAESAVSQDSFQS